LASLLKHVRPSARGSFYTMIPSRIAQSVQLWKTYLPSITPFYAVKCNPDPRLLQSLHSAEVNFDCASSRELSEVQNLLGTTLPGRVVYANPCKSSHDVMAAQKMGSPVTVVDSEEEVVKLAEHSYSGGALLRIAVDDTKSDMPFSSKFGACVENIEQIAKKAYESNIQIHGFSFHVGSGSRDPLAFATAMRYAMTCEKMLLSQNHRPTILDIGGGFLADAADFRAKVLHIQYALTHAKNYRVWAEPGRFFATGAFDFYVQVIGKKPAFVHGTQYGWRYTIDDSIYGQFSCILFDKAKPKWVRVIKEGESPRPFTKGTLFGRTCDSFDKIAESDSMEELEVGDWLWFPRMGAYTRATASEFNGFPNPEVIVMDPSVKIDPTIAGSSPFLAKGTKYQGL